MMRFLPLMRHREILAERLGGCRLLTFTDPAEGMRVINAERPDIVFLDIEMENINGLSIASSLPKGYVSYLPQPICSMRSMVSISTLSTICTNRLPIRV